MWELGVNSPHYRSSLIHDEPFFLARSDPEYYPEWEWNKKERRFSARKPDDVTVELRARSRLATAKCRAIAEIINTINTLRQPMRTDMTLQESVYLIKRMQAQAFKDANYDQKMVMEIPYVVQYADLASISFKEAADNILFRAQLDDGYLAKTELLRLKYFDLVREASEPAQIPSIMKQLKIDSYSSQLT